MAKNVGKKIEEIKKEVEAEVKDVKASVHDEEIKVVTDASEALEKLKEDLKSFTIDHHNVAVINIALEAAIKGIDGLNSGMKFIKKALEEKRTKTN
jgi:TPP-dependent trihydroxycyclohexane-1,2-dione (THcHDO) dehydratase